MRTESKTRPLTEFDVEFNGDNADILFYCNITEEEREGETFYIYDMYRTSVPYTVNIASRVERNYQAFLSQAMANERQPEPTEEEKRDAQILYTAIMTDTLLEDGEDE